MSSVDHSVTPLYAQALLQSAQRLGIALPAELIARLQGNERIPLEVQDELWDSYCRLSGDPLAGLRLGLEVQVGHLDSAGMLLVTCETLGEALSEQVEYAPLIGAGGEFQLLRDGEEVAIDYAPQLRFGRPSELKRCWPGSSIDPLGDRWPLRPQRHLAGARTAGAARDTRPSADRLPVALRGRLQPHHLFC
ncbi:AraC family transcriptional regulator ligand-binding domain-containing protein [Halopseudomonas pachastrellae]|nr:AraC family transcriptional regulator ligand-binding domain-containing protein [Halopseudomonas pachastrellae]